MCRLPYKLMCVMYMLYRCDSAVDVGPAWRLGGQPGEHTGAARLAR